MGNCVKPIDPLVASLPRNDNMDMAPLKNRHLPIIIIYGGPGTGKATQSNLISKKYNLIRISCGDLLRDEVSKGNPRGIAIAKIMTDGQLVPAGVVLDLIKERMLATYDGARGFVIDGYPREKRQALQLDEEIAPADLVVYLTTSDKLLWDRCQGRAVTSGRKNDTNEAIGRRIRLYREKRAAIVKHYGERLVEVDAARDVEAVFNDVCRKVDEALGKFA